jgi:pimeloyl-ACP methyl ester carboxylesterase
VYYGRSWGGRQGPIMVAVEPRFKSAVLYLAGLTLQRTQPEVDPFNYAPRVTVPLLLLSGRYDFVFPYKASSALFRSLGTPPEHKRHMVEDGGHFIPRDILVREVLDWLDRYAGPVPR